MPEGDKREKILLKDLSSFLRFVRFVRTLACTVRSKHEVHMKHVHFMFHSTAPFPVGRAEIHYSSNTDHVHKTMDGRTVRVYVLGGVLYRSGTIHTVLRLYPQRRKDRHFTVASCDTL